MLNTDFSHDKNRFLKCKLSGIPLKPRQHDGVCVGGGEKRGLWGGGVGQLSVMRFFVLGHNKANMCTSSAVMEELVCLSSKWNILEASNPAG